MLVQNPSLGENGGMRKICTFLALMCVALCAFAAEKQTVRTALPSKASAVLLPVDRTIGQTCSCTETEAHQALFDMLKEPYSFEWTESHIAEDVRTALVRLFGDWLSNHLGSSDILMSVANDNSDGSCGISVRIADSCMAFVLKENMIISMREL